MMGENRNVYRTLQKSLILGDSIEHNENLVFEM